MAEIPILTVAILTNLKQWKEKENKNRRASPSAATSSNLSVPFKPEVRKRESAVNSKTIDLTLGMISTKDRRAQWSASLRIGLLYNLRVLFRSRAIRRASMRPLGASGNRNRRSRWRRRFRHVIRSRKRGSEVVWPSDMLLSQDSKLMMARLHLSHQIPRVLRRNSEPGQAWPQQLDYPVDSVANSPPNLDTVASPIAEILATKPSTRQMTTTSWDQAKTSGPRTLKPATLKNSVKITSRLAMPRWPTSSSILIIMHKTHTVPTASKRTTTSSQANFSWADKCSAVIFKCQTSGGTPTEYPLPVLKTRFIQTLIPIVLRTSIRLLIAIQAKSTRPRSFWTNTAEEIWERRSFRSDHIKQIMTSM